MENESIIVNLIRDRLDQTDKNFENYANNMKDSLATMQATFKAHAERLTELEEVNSVNKGRIQVIGAVSGAIATVVIGMVTLIVKAIT